MPQEFKAEQVINGTWGEAWVDGEYLAQTTALKAKVNLKKSSIPMVRRLNEGQKITGIELKGEIKLHKINSTIMRKMSEYFKRGKMMTCTIVSNLADPDALGGERVALYNCVFDDLILIDWELGKISEEAYNFTYETWDILQSI